MNCSKGGWVIWVVLTVSGCLRMGFGEAPPTDPPAMGDNDDVAGDPGDSVGDPDLGCDSPATVVVEPAYPVAGAAWNDYVRVSVPAAGRFHQADVICSGGVFEAGNYTSCIHGGEVRAVRLASETSCVGLTATDSLAAFTWRCDDSSGTVAFFSRGLAPKKGLAHLVSAAGFLANSVEVRREGEDCVVAASSPSAWWSNPVLALPDNDGTTPATTLETTSAIYVLATPRSSSGYGVNADRVAVVTLGDVELTYGGGAGAGYCDSSGEIISGGDHAVLCAGGQKFLWIEVRVGGAGAERLRFASLAYSRLHRVRSHGHQLENVLLSGGRSNLITELDVWSSGSMGAAFSNTTDLMLVDARAVANAYNGFEFTSSTKVVGQRLLATNNASGGLVIFTSDHATFVDVIIASTRYDGIYIDHASDLILNMVTAVGNGGAGARILASGTEITVSQLVTGNNVSGLAVGGSNNHFVDVVAADNSNLGVQIDSTWSAAIGNTFDGGLWVGNNGVADCTVEDPDNTLASDCAHGNPTVPATSGFSLAATFVERVVTDDPANPIDSGGLVVPSDAAAGWLPLASHWRAWGKEGATLSAPIEPGDCAGSPSCRIWDWRLRRTDVGLRNRMGAFSAGLPCPPAVSGADPAMVTSASSQTYLRNAVEIWDDGSGDDDGLCESNERCVFAPNLGAYQGEGELSAGTCTFINGSISGVMLYGYADNGG